MQRYSKPLLSLAMIAIGFVACGSQDKASDKGAQSQVPPQAGKKANGGTVEGPNPAFLGRVGLDADNFHILGWPGSRVVVSFTGDSINIPLSFVSTGLDFGVFVNVDIDGNKKDIEILNKTPQDYTFQATANGQTTHTLILTKSSSPGYGNLKVGDIQLSEQDKQLKNQLPATKLLFIGDSISVGYGVLAQSFDECSATGQSDNINLLKAIDIKSNVIKAYPWLVGEEMQADVQVIAISGRGLARNRPNSGDVPTMPQIWKNLNPSSNTVTLQPGETWVPDAIVINLGTNDFANNDMTEQEFTQAGLALIDDIGTIYPDSKLVFVTGPMVFGSNVEKLSKATQAIVKDNSKAFVADIGVQDIQNTGCDYHPSEKVQSLMAKHLVSGQQETSPYIIKTQPWQGLKKVLDLQ